jgi:arylsulfatase A
MRFGIFIAVWIAGILFGQTNTCVATVNSPPNFIVILGEGAGWTSSSVQMDDRNPASKGRGIRTPNLERLAAQGMRFSDGYAASPRCTPSRAALFTGKSPAQLRMTFVNEGRRDSGGDPKGRVITPNVSVELPSSEITIAEFLKRAGYVTAHFGKWHVGRLSPAQHGFDENDGANGNGGPDNIAAPNPKQALAITAKGIDFLTRQAKAGRPFYLQMSHYPNQPEKGSARRPPPVDEDIAIVDKTLGQILDALDRLGMNQNTYVIYTTDHGAPGRNLPLRGGKGTVWEGGLRVPFFVAGPGVKANSVSHVRISAIDLFPTIAELAGIHDSLPLNLEGGSFNKVLKNAGSGDVKRLREEFVFHFPHYDKDVQGPASAIILGDYKLIRIYETGASSLYDIAKDPYERDNVAAQLPAKTAELNQRLTAYLTAVHAQLPRTNPDYDPTKATELKRGGGKRKALQ